MVQIHDRLYQPSSRFIMIIIYSVKPCRIHNTQTQVDFHLPCYNFRTHRCPPEMCPRYLVPQICWETWRHRKELDLSGKQVPCQLNTSPAIRSTMALCHLSDSFHIQVSSAADCFLMKAVNTWKIRGRLKSPGWSIENLTSNPSTST